MQYSYYNQRQNQIKPTPQVPQWDYQSGGPAMSRMS